MVLRTWRCAAVGIVAVAALVWAPPARSAESASATAAGEFARGDKLAAQGKLEDARAAFQAALATEPLYFRALCALSRVETQLGEDAKDETQRRLVASAVEHARAAVKAAPDSGSGHVCLAEALAAQSEREGPKTRLALAREIESEIDRGIGLDPTQPRAYVARALWNRDLSRLGLVERALAHTVLGGVPKGASMDNAVRDLEKATALDPAAVDAHMELGRTYMQLKRRGQAVLELQRAIAIQPATARDAKFQADARTLLAQLAKSR